MFTKDWQADDACMLFPPVEPTCPTHGYSATNVAGRSLVIMVRPKTVGGQSCLGKTRLLHVAVAAGTCGSGRRFVFRGVYFVKPNPTVPSCEL